MRISIRPAPEAHGATPLDGVWNRRSLSVNGGTPFEDSQVTWAQLGPWFVDLRSPQNDGGRAAAFSGHIAWAPPQVRFVRDLDLEPGTVEAPALLEVVEDELVEHGTVQIGDRSIPYVEVWSRRTLDVGPQIVLEGRISDSPALAGRLIQVGSVLAALVAQGHNDVRAIALEASANGWGLLHQVGELPWPPVGGVVAGSEWAGLTWTRAA